MWFTMQIIIRKGNTIGIFTYVVVEAGQFEGLLTAQRGGARYNGHVQVDNPGRVSAVRIKNTFCAS